jgi:glycerol kinase
MMKKYIMVIDEGTTGTRALLFNKGFKIISQSYEEFTQYTPNENMVEHNALEIYQKSVKMCQNAMRMAGVTANDIAAIGITNQRATCVVWDKVTGVPLYNSIVWQDIRTADICREINESEWGEKVRKATGWTVAPVYTSMMIKWYIDHVPAVKIALENGTALIGTIDTWLIWNLTGKAVHAVSYSNASVMGSLNIHTGEWYTDFLDYLGIPIAAYPQICDDSGDFGQTSPEIFGAAIPICAAIADQHAALFAQGCREGGTGKITNGTGSFLDINIGHHCVISEEGLNTVIAWKLGNERTYALEGYESVTGSAIQWLRDGLRIIEHSSETESMALSVSDANGVVFVPALAGLSAPYHDAFSRGTVFGITRGTKREHLVRATLEGIAYRLKDILNAVEKESGVKMTDIRIDGGASNNNFLAQTMADMLGAKVNRPSSVEATSLGAAEMAALAIGFWTFHDMDSALTIERSFTPLISENVREKRYSEWQDAIQRSMGWMQGK